jgi:hypothetical protein
VGVNYCSEHINFTMVLYRKLVLLVALLSVGAEAKRFGAVQSLPSSNSVQRLHEILCIGSNPNEDIRTNVLLNMEGI